MLVARTRRPGVTILTDHQARTENLYNMIILSHLLTRMLEANIKIDLPDRLKQYLIKSLKTIGRKIENKEQAGKILDIITKAISKPNLLIKIEADTSLEDVRRTWPQVELRKLQILGNSQGEKPPRRRRIWRTYERDIFIWKRVKLDGRTYETAYDEWLLNHPEDKPVEISAVIKSVNRIVDLPRED